MFFEAAFEATLTITLECYRSLFRGCAFVFSRSFRTTLKSRNQVRIRLISIARSQQSGTNMIIMHMQRWAGSASEFPRRPEGFWPRRTARRPAKEMGRRPSTSAENFRRTCPDICPTSRELGWGTPPDVQRKCAPTSNENVP